MYLEGRHVIEMAPDRYLGAWRSVNDLQVQLGPEKFDSFLNFVKKRISEHGSLKRPILPALGPPVATMTASPLTLSTKAGTLSKLQGTLKAARMAPMRAFTVADWNVDRMMPLEN